MKRKVANVHGTRSAYLDAGEGDAVVALHGVPTSSALFEPLLPHLSGRRLIAPDLLGQGETETPNGRLDHAAYGAHLAVFLEAVPPPVFDLVVHDLGGVLGLEWAAGHRERIRKLVVLSTASGPSLRWSLLCAAIYALEAVGGASAVRAGILRTAKRPGAVPPALADAWARPWTRGRALRGLDHFARAHLARVAAALPSLDMPALVVWGERDDLFPVWHGEAIARALPRARLVTIPGAGHWLPLDAPELVGREIASFLES
jgi:pimeloyl-ACP methyl ester carboxylesterase